LRPANWEHALAVPEPRKGMPDSSLDEAQFRSRFLAQFQDPAFDPLLGDLDRVAGAAWDAYSNHRNSPRTQKAGQGYANPDYDLAVDWIAARRAVLEAERRFRDEAGPPTVLLVNAAARSEHTCPGEMSKTYRLSRIAQEVLEAGGVRVNLLDLSRTVSEYGRHIHPCKTCFSTSAALCHWPCSCYPNYSLGQTQDWMNDIYPMWVEAHGVMIVTPVNWYQASSPLKLMMDRLVCADGGNADPTSTSGKDAAKAKALELGGWPYPRHLAGRVFAVVAHGDSAGVEGLRRSLADWLTDMGLHSAGATAELDRYIGYYKPYATSHEELDRDEAIQDEVRNAAATLVAALRRVKAGEIRTEEVADPRPK
jgi:multimeric flavodoxin WrbA